MLPKLLARLFPSVGTRSILFGAHCVLLHGWFVLAAWWRLYGFPRDPRLWLAFFAHDLGYAGKHAMDDAEGERHPEFGARLMRVFGPEWHDLCLYHSRFYAKRHHRQPSRLCAADKLAFGMTPRWLYLPMVRATGEIEEYMLLAKEGKYVYAGVDHRSQTKWHRDIAAHMTAWALEHAYGGEDTWTPESTELR